MLRGWEKWGGKGLVFTLLIWALILWGINLLCGLIAGNRYIAVDPIDKKTALTSWGYFAPNQNKRILYFMGKEYRVTTNGLGLRATGTLQESLDDIKDKYRILALGDSIIFGLFVDDEDTFPYRLQNILSREGKNAVVLNAGVGSALMQDYVHYLKVKGLGLKPDLLIVGFCENDLEGLDRPPLYERMKNDNVFNLAKTIKLANFMRVFRKAEYRHHYRRFLKKQKDPRIKSILERESKDLEDVLYVATENKMRPAIDPYNEIWREPWQKNFQAMDEIIGLARQADIDVVFVIFPDIVTVFDRARGYYQDILIDYFNKKGVKYVDMLPAFKKKKDQFAQLYWNLPRDFHLSGDGNQVMAEEVYRLIQDMVQGEGRTR